MYTFIFIRKIVPITRCIIIAYFAFHSASMTVIHFLRFFSLISGEPIDIMKPRAVAACNDKIARDIVKIIREADQRVDMRAKE